MSNTKRALALGFFDGMHCAHQAVVKAAAEYADANGLIPAAVTFDRHPQSALLGEREVLLNTLDERIEAFHDLGIRDVTVLPFEEIRNMPWEQFLKETLVETLDAGFVSTGYDFRFGKGGMGTVSALQDGLRAFGIPCEMIPRMTTDTVHIGEVAVEYASSTIRKCIAMGELALANKLLGHPHYITGEVIHGKALGRTIGSPTMNVAFAPQVVIPRPGVYATDIVIDGIVYPSVTNVSGGSCPLAEAYVFDFNRDVYGKRVRIKFLKFIRDMRPFPSLEALRAQISADMVKVRAFFEEQRKNT